ncbi:MAG: PhnD/SsuA/transferrin family substrate-binding protein [Xanthobacteraceae bacterium]|nr:PhnD/SsuA/transferrin family substrate-binding protein [Xanthobacteraceae bacterium]
MYRLPEVAAATAALWDALRVRLVARGLAIDDVIFADAAAPVPEGIGPHVFFTQVCGYPLFKVFRDQGAILATPSYAFAGCEGPNHCAFFIVRANDPARRLEELRGRVFGCNSRLSNSGMNLPRLALARIARGKPFFQQVVMTGGHLASLDHLHRATIDLCAIDCVTWGLVQKFRPDQAARYRILAQTAPSPSLPFVTSTTTNAPTITTLRDALSALFADAETASIRETLGLTGVSNVDSAAYERLADYEQEANDLGYPILE